MKKLKKELDKKFLEEYDLKDRDIFKLVSNDKDKKVYALQIIISAGEVGFVVLDGNIDPFLAHPKDVVTMLRYFENFDIITLNHVPLKYKLCDRDCSHCPIKVICDDFGRKDSEADKLWEKFEKSKKTAISNHKFDFTIYNIIEKRLEQEVWQEK